MLSYGMPIAADTSPEADAVQVEAYRRMGGAGRVQVMFRLNEMVRRTAMAGIRRRHPEYGDADVLLALAQLLYGEDLVRQAWPGQRLPGPVSPEQEALFEVIRALESQGIPHMVTGSVASSYHGRPRSTHDADIVIDPSRDQLDALVRVLGDRGLLRRRRPGPRRARFADSSSTRSRREAPSRSISSFARTGRSATRSSRVGKPPSCRRGCACLSHRPRTRSSRSSNGRRRPDARRSRSRTRPASSPSTLGSIDVTSRNGHASSTSSTSGERSAAKGP